MKFAVALGENTGLRNLVIGYNKLLEDQSWKLTAKHIEEGLTEAPLSEKNQLFMDSLKNFIKYNPYLVHLDLQTTGLSAPIIRLIGHMITRATGLQCIHLCGNEGITDDMIEWLRKRIHAKEDVEPVLIHPLPKKFHSKQPPESSPQTMDAMSLFGIGKPKETVDPNA